MKYKLSERGFSGWLCKAHGGVDYIIQKSSAVAWKQDDERIWVGAAEERLIYFVPNGDPSWVEVNLKQEYPNGFITHHRVELTAKQVREMLPILEFFARTGDLPNEEYTSMIGLKNTSED